MNLPLYSAVQQAEPINNIGVNLISNKDMFFSYFILIIIAE